MLYGRHSAVAEFWRRTTPTSRDHSLRITSAIEMRSRVACYHRPRSTPSKPVGGEVVEVIAPDPLWVAGFPGMPASTNARKREIRMVDYCRWRTLPGSGVRRAPSAIKVECPNERFSPRGAHEPCNYNTAPISRGREQRPETPCPSAAAEVFEPKRPRTYQRFRG
jgi:hypothetical protein